jgi:hypothetical protein
MKQRWAARCLVLALCVIVPRFVEAQGQRQGREPTTGSVLGQNYPNPFKETTTIPFSIGGAPECADPSKQYRVTLRIYNMLAQLVAIPVLQGGSAGVATGQPLREVVLTCGQYTAQWDGKYTGSSRELASGVYLYHLEVDGRAIVRKMVFMR